MTTSDLDQDFLPTLKQVARDLSTPDCECKPLDMLKVMMSESGVKAEAHNNGPEYVLDKVTGLRRVARDDERYHASGLIQFMPATLPGVGWHAGHAAFRELSATEQLPYVRRYYSAYRGHLGSVGALYTATFMPALVSHASDPSFVLTAKAGPYGWAYAPNACFDANGDLQITVGELEAAVARNCVGARWQEIVARLGGDEVPDTEREAAPFDVRTTLGLQQALSRLGFDPGPIDGLPGRRTRAAVVLFQAQHDLVADGIVGPKTRDELEVALKTAA